MMAGVCARVGPRGVYVWTGVIYTGFGGGLSGMCAEGIMGTLGGNAVGLSLGTLVEGAGKSGWNTNAGEGCGALRAGAVGGLAVTLEKIWESVWMEANCSSPSVANGVGVGCNRASVSARAAVVAELVELPDGTGKS